MKGFNNYHLIINLVHILIQGSLLVFIGYKKEKTPKFIFYILALLALLIPFSIYRPSTSISYWNLVNIMHYLFVMPLFLYIAYKQKFTKEIYENIFIFGIIVIVYHLYKLFIRIKKLKLE